MSSDKQKRYIFLSDVHLNPKHPVRAKRFLGFLDSITKHQGDELYILGDLFDLWIGPKHIKLPDYQSSLKALKKLSRAGVRINFIAGNRDFQIEQTFTRATGVRILGDSAVLKLDTKKVWLTHGDLLCSKDLGYTSYRRLARSKMFQAAYQSLPEAASYGIGEGLRQLSAKLVAKKPVPDRNIVLKTVRACFNKGYDVIICGHIHRSEKKNIKMPTGQPRLLFTLGRWTDRNGHYLTYDKRSGFKLCRT
ncbi:MAG: UDP-2,3-diacylglucosamine diphosphatase [Planctomycetes bacterium]|nr:UDP-2,3-diacylglucosamine diphosphatase [Planctomycetota bacterium]